MGVIGHNCAAMTDSGAFSVFGPYPNQHRSHYYVNTDAKLIIPTLKYTDVEEATAVSGFPGSSWYSD